MAWFLILVGVLLLGFGVFAAMSREMKAEKVAPKAPLPKGNDENAAWDVLTQPLPERQELIPIPERRHWYHVDKFGQGVAVGLGAGFLVAALAVAITPGTGETKSGNDAPPAGQETPVGQIGEPGQTGQTGQPAPAPEPPAPPPEPAPVVDYTFEVEMGELPGDVAEKLASIQLIPSEEAFLDRLVERGLDGLLKVGTFTVPSDATVDEIIDILTR